MDGHIWGLISSPIRIQLYYSSMIEGQNALIKGYKNQLEQISLITNTQIGGLINTNLIKKN